MISGSIRPRLPAGGDLRLLVVGGTGEYLARLVPEQQRITGATIADVLRQLEALAASDVARLLDIAEARARVLPAGVAIVAAIMELTDPHRIGVARSGIRTGLLLAAFEEPVTADAAHDATGDPR